LKWILSQKKRRQGRGVRSLNNLANQSEKNKQKDPIPRRGMLQFMLFVRQETKDDKREPLCWEKKARNLGALIANVQPIVGEKQIMSPSLPRPRKKKKRKNRVWYLA